MVIDERTADGVAYNAARVAASRPARQRSEPWIRQLVVPIDGSPCSWKAFDVAMALAERSGTDVWLIVVAEAPSEVARARDHLDSELVKRQPLHVDTKISIDVRLSEDSVAAEIDDLAWNSPGSLIVMSTHGRGRSSVIVGSVARDVLARTFGPVMLVGPNVEVDDFSGPVVVTVDGSAESEAALPLAAAWSDRLGTTAWIVTVTDPATRLPDDVLEAGYPARLAGGLRSDTGYELEFEVLHDRDPVRGIVDDAVRRSASLIVASSHGGGAVSRLLMGSATAGFVRRAPCPVLVLETR